ncbi:MAG TPA: SUMF1/EgtB/PvdO family nonheme iron enzyme, partial [Aggregatilineales bacterium]|nr:SUMF1/EgtB/PvdO family nonheme iron enzyme [Aggregatilineales bacterium]
IMTMLPPPFEWITIPEGQVILKPSKYVHDYIKTDTTFTVPTFHISKTPITNAQYAKFIEIGGYDNRQWWTQAGWQAKIDGWDDIFVAELERESSLHWMPTGTAWSCPRFWHDKRFNGDNQPVVGISWYETMAFCSWLRSLT